MMLVWLKAFHIIFVICWFAGIFYLPRLFVHHAMSEDQATRERLSIMERKLFRFITPLAVIAIVLGVWIIMINPALMQQGWMHVKLLCVFILIIYHGFCGYYQHLFSKGENPHSHRYFRWFNEFPVLLLVIIVIMVIVRPV